MKWVAVIIGLMCFAGTAKAQQTNCGQDPNAHVIGSSESCTKFFSVSGRCNDGTLTPFGGDVAWYTNAWADKSITLVEIDYDILIQGPPGVVYYGQAFVGNTWTPDPMTEYETEVSFPSQNSGGTWGGLILKARTQQHGSQFPSYSTGGQGASGQHLDMHLSCYYYDNAGNHSPVFSGNIRVVYLLNPL